MEGTQNHSKACCNVPPAVTKDYQPKGKYIDLPSPSSSGGDNMKCYATGSPDAPSAILIIYDVFGFSPQAIQGADILAYAAAGAQNNHHGYRVFVPDFFLGKTLARGVIPPDTEEKKKQLGEFFAGPAHPQETAKKVPELVKEIEKSQAGTGIKKWGSLGMCWGGKIVSLTSQPGTSFTAAAEVHPAMVDPADAKGIKIPLCMLASGDEDANAVKAFGENLTSGKHIETFGDQVHGWMAARGDLEDERVKKEYERGYQVLLDFYCKHL